MMAGSDTVQEHAAWVEFVSAYEAMDARMELVRSRTTLAEWEHAADETACDWQRLKDAWRAYVELKDGRHHG